ncbi:hypothetical protein ANCCEY_04843 [Ancylostoma ceylanicum]|uniref:G-protein coupled receptors family 1 profile domain-containing protein n=1 Tax=Ancylostoma ceylanicum TaxID=53326 RepID=A0A0D6LVH5_9BILA|nr:hypothetical protein ANCCEY_04843 [Ancylostoma ceylanicum]
MTTPSPLDCDTMVAMATSPALISALAVCDLCCIVAAPLLIYWLVRIWKMKLMHYNTRLLVCFHIACLLVHVLGRCFFLRLPYNIALISSNCSAIFVSIERLVATFNIRNYEGRFRNVGYCLLLLQVFMSSCLLSVIYSRTRLDYSPLVYCQTTSTSNVMWTIYPFGFLLLMQFLSSIVFEVARRKNKGYSEASACSGTLTRRYQIEENIWTIRTLKVYVYTNGTFNATYLIALSAVIFNNHLFSKPIYYMLIEVTNVQYLYALTLPLVLWYNRKDVQNQIRYAVSRDMGMNYNRIFEQLRSQWDSSSVKGGRNSVFSAAATQFLNKKAAVSKS